MIHPQQSSVRRPPLRFLGRVLGVAVAAALATALILASVTQTTQLSVIVRRLVMALVYSCCIAIPSALVLTHLKTRGGERRSSVSILIRVAVLLAMNVIGCLVGGLVLAVTGMVPYGQYWKEFFFAVELGAVITLTFGLSMSFYWGVRQRLESATLELRTRQMEEERAHKLLAEARLSSLESRIHPHFLFNTLNSIASLIPKDPKKAEDTVGKLASLLRFSLNASQTGLVPLAQELKVVRDYLEIEKVRFGARLRYAIEVPAELEEVGVPPLSLESLVENSVKHVIAPQPDGGDILVTAAVRADRIDLEVSDSGPGFALETIPLGHGLDNLTARLALLFGAEARLVVDRDGGRSAVRLSLPRGAR
jgi:sensor histidine kinase YesM